MKKIGLLIPLFALSLCLAGCSRQEEDAIVLRVANWEEYIDLGGWEEEETIDLESCEILGENSMIEDFEAWYEETYGKAIKVEYSTFGTCEELYNQLTIGDTYDLACPSEYMIMKMQREGLLVPYSESFYDTEIEENYYARNVSPFIKNRLDYLQISGEPLSRYGACYMWGTLGFVYNPEEVDEEAVSHWNLLTDPDYRKRVTIKDSVRDTYFAALGAVYYEECMQEELRGSSDYLDRLSEILNRTDEATVDKVEDFLSEAKENVYSFETDSGKADMVTGKVLANLQWSGDAVYTMDQAEEDDLELCYSAPEESTNLWFDGWIMFRKGVGDDPERKQAAEAFVNFLSRPDNAIRNMYYIGYTSSISGGDSGLIYEYLDWNYGAEEDEEETVPYPLGYFFAYGEEGADEDYVIETTPDQTRRQLFAQYPPEEIIDRAVVMRCFEDEDNDRINRMWINVRCFDLGKLFGKS